MVKVEVDLKLDPELMGLIESVETELHKEIYQGKVILFAERYEVDSVQTDIHKLIEEADKIKKVYETVSYPYQAIEILRSEKVEVNQSASNRAPWSSK